MKRMSILLFLCLLLWSSMAAAEVERIVGLDLQYTITDEGCMCLVAADNLKQPSIYQWACSCGGWVSKAQEVHVGVTGHQVAVFRQWYKRMHRWHYGYNPKFERPFRIWLKWLE